MKNRVFLSIPLAIAGSFVFNSCQESEAEHRGPSEETVELKEKIAELTLQISKLKAEMERLEGESAPRPVMVDGTNGLASVDPAVGREAVTGWSRKGPAVLPELRKIAFKHESATARQRAKEAIGQITGQWGSQTDLVWKRSVADAVNPDKPLIVLQLFGSLDEEFC